MADFTARFSAGVTLREWEDPASGEKPSRINPVAGFPPRRYQAIRLTDIVEISATVNGVETPLDVDLGGRLFTTWFVEAPVVQGIDQPAAGKSSYRAFMPARAGHYLIGMRRVGGGAVFMHLDVQDN